jgi:D-inositol-3-phosphate glycosyltransferase
MLKQSLDTHMTDSPTRLSSDLLEERASVALLTGGGDSPYAFGLSTALDARRIHVDLIVGDELDIPELHGRSHLNVLNLRGEQQPAAGIVRKMTRVLTYYARLIRYAVTAKPRVFHILWNNKFEFVDRTLLMLFYVSLGKKVVLTAHNVNAGKRDGTDSVLNRLTLRVQYRLAEHIFVHTERMKQELVADFGVRGSAVTVIPFGINNAVPDTALTPSEAKRKLGINQGEKVLLFFGNIAPYKGLEYLLSAFVRLCAQVTDYRLLVVGRPKGPCEYWTDLEEMMAALDSSRVIKRIEYVPDQETELYFKAADVLVLPYTEVFQSGVLFLGYSFGLPALVANVGSLRDDVVEGETGFVFRPRDVDDLTQAALKYFSSDLFRGLPDRRRGIRERAREQHSWDTVASITEGVYSVLSNGTKAEARPRLATRNPSPPTAR